MSSENTVTEDIIDFAVTPGMTIDEAVKKAVDMYHHSGKDIRLVFNGVKMFVDPWVCSHEDLTRFYWKSIAQAK